MSVNLYRSNNISHSDIYNYNHDEIIKSGWEYSLSSDYESIIKWVSTLYNYESILDTSEYSISYKELYLGHLLSKIEKMIYRLPPTCQIMVLDQLVQHGILLSIDLPDEMVNVDNVNNNAIDYDYSKLLLRFSKTNLLFRPDNATGQLKFILDLFLPYQQTSPFHEFMIRYCIEYNMRPVLEAYIIWYGLYKLEIFNLPSINEFFHLSQQPGGEIINQSNIDLFRPSYDSITDALKNNRIGGQAALASLLCTSPESVDSIRLRVFDSILRTYPHNTEYGAIVESTVVGSTRTLRAELESPLEGLNLPAPSLNAQTIREVRLICNYLNDTILLEQQSAEKFLPDGVIDCATSLRDLSMCPIFDSVLEEQLGENKSHPDAEEVFTGIRNRALFDLPFSPQDANCFDVDHACAELVRSIRSYLIAGRPMKAFDSVFRFLLTLPLPAALLNNSNGIAYPYTKPVAFHGAVNMMELDPKFVNMYKSLFNATAIVPISRIFIELAYKVALCNFSLAYVKPKLDVINIPEACLIYVDLLDQLLNPKASRHMARLSFLLKMANVIKSSINHFSNADSIKELLYAYDTNGSKFELEIQIADVLFRAQSLHLNWIETSNFAIVESFYPDSNGTATKIVDILRLINDAAPTNDLELIEESKISLSRLFFGSHLVFNLPFSAHLSNYPDSDSDFIQFMAGSCEILCVSPSQFIYHISNCMVNNTSLSDWLEQLASKIGAKIGSFAYLKTEKDRQQTFTVDGTTSYLHRFMLALTYALDHNLENIANPLVVCNPDDKGDILSREPGTHMLIHSLTYSSPLYDTEMSDPLLPFLAFHLPGATRLDSMIIWLHNAILRLTCVERFPVLPVRQLGHDGKFPSPYADPDIQNGQLINPGYSFDFLPLFVENNLFHLLKVALALFYGPPESNSLSHFVFFLQCFVRDDVRNAKAELTKYVHLINTPSIHLIDVEETVRLARKLMVVLRTNYRKQNRRPYFDELFNYILKECEYTLQDIFPDEPCLEDDDKDSADDTRSTQSISYVYSTKEDWSIKGRNSEYQTSISDKLLLAKTAEFIELKGTFLYELESERLAYYNQVDEEFEDNDVSFLHRGSFYYRVLLSSFNFSYSERLVILVLLSKYWNTNTEEIHEIASEVNAYHAWVKWLSTPILSPESTNLMSQLPITGHGLHHWPALSIIDAVKTFSGNNISLDGYVDSSFVDLIEEDFLLLVVYRLLSEHELLKVGKLISSLQIYTRHLSTELLNLFYFIPVLLYIAGYTVPSDSIKDLDVSWWKAWLLSLKLQNSLSTIVDLNISNNVNRDPMMFNSIEPILLSIVKLTKAGKTVTGIVEELIPKPQEFHLMISKSKFAVSIQAPWAIGDAIVPPTVHDLTLRAKIAYLDRAVTAFPALTIFCEWLQMHLYYNAENSGNSYVGQLDTPCDFFFPVLLAKETNSEICNWICKSLLDDGYVSLYCNDQKLTLKNFSTLLSLIYRHNLLNMSDTAFAIYSCFLQIFCTTSRGKNVWSDQPFVWSRDTFISWAKCIDVSYAGVLNLAGKLFLDRLVSETAKWKDQAAFPDAELVELALAAYFCYFAALDKQGMLDAIGIIEPLSKEWRYEYVVRFLQLTAEFDVALGMSRRIFKLSTSVGVGSEAWNELLAYDAVNPARMAAAVEALCSKYGVKYLGLDHRNEYYTLILSSKINQIVTKLKQVYDLRNDLTGADYLFGLESFWTESVVLARTAKLSGLQYQSMAFAKLLHLVQLEMCIIPKKTRAFVEQYLEGSSDYDGSTTSLEADSWSKIWSYYHKGSKVPSSDNLWWSKVALEKFIADSTVASESVFGIRLTSNDFGYAENANPMQSIFNEEGKHKSRTMFTLLKEKIQNITRSIHCLITHSHDETLYVHHNDLVKFMQPREDRKLGTALHQKVQDAAARIVSARRKAEVFPQSVLFFSKNESGYPCVAINSANLNDYKSALSYLSGAELEMFRSYYTDVLTPKVKLAFNV